MDSGSIGFGSFLALGVMILLSAFFSASETALSSVSKIRLKNMADDGNRKARSALHLAERFDLTLSAILVGNNVVNIAAASSATVIADVLFGSSGIAIATGVMTIVILIFGEIVPKSYAKEHSEQLSLAFAGILGFLIRVLYPIVYIFMKLQNYISHLYGDTTPHPIVTEQELVTIIETIEEGGFIDRDKSELVQSALEFDDIALSEILTPRVDLVAIDIEDSKEEILALIYHERYSRLPVYEGNIDNIIGILQTRDYLEATIRQEEVSLRDLISKPIFAHRSKKLPALLTEFQHTRSHLAVITDDYGGTQGIVTMEDLLEELVGEIWDEDEEAIPEMQKIGEYRYDVKGDYNIYDLFDIIGYNTRGFDSEYSSLAGWAFEQFGEIPAVGDRFEVDGITVTVKAKDEQRLTLLEVEYMPPIEDDQQRRM